MDASSPRTLDQWTPNDAWAAWQATRDDPWSLKWAGHLLRRAAFGYPALRGGEDAWDGIARIVQQGCDATLTELFQPAPAEFDELLDTAGQHVAGDDDVGNLRGWWLYRMLYTPQPLVERMTLFWHNHFATSINKVRRVTWMYTQNQTLRRGALGKFGPLLQAMSRDPAMISWLDLNRNITGRANENYGRELLELFTLGVGNYSERDVQETARAFTGGATLDNRYRFNPKLHDAEPKTIFGQTGNFRGDDVARILLEQPAAARFLVRKLFRYFISEAEIPPASLIEPLAQQLRESDYDVGLIVRRMLASKLFFSETAYRQRIKSPVEYVVGTLLGLGAKIPMQRLVSLLDGLGQDLFAPPNVKGWDGGKAWLNSATLLARHNLLWSLVVQTDDDCRPAELVARHAGDAATQEIGFFADLFLPGDGDASMVRRLTQYFDQSEAPDVSWDRRLRETLHMLLILPEYHLA